MVARRTEISLLSVLATNPSWLAGLALQACGAPHLRGLQCCENSAVPMICIRRRCWGTALQNLLPNVEANRHFAAGRVWARLLKPKPGPPQSVRLSDQLGRAA